MSDVVLLFEDIFSSVFERISASEGKKALTFFVQKNNPYSPKPGSSVSVTLKNTQIYFCSTT